MIDTLLEVRIKNPDDFLKVKETLTRIGVPSFKDKKLYQSCHILHKKGKYFIVHFKELFALDGKTSTLSEEDLARRNTIAKLLAEWDLISIVDASKMVGIAPMNSVKIVPYKEKHDWDLVAKYTIGVRH